VRVLPRLGLSNMRLNNAIARLEAGETVFGCIPTDDDRELAAVSRSEYDLLIVETEHTGFSGQRLQQSLQGLLDREQLTTRDSLAPRVTPLVRTPANARERNEWVIKQTLD